MHKNMPRKYQHMQPKGSLIATDSSFPEGLLAVTSPEGQPRIIVPPGEIKALILQTHEDIHHQNHVKVLHVLKSNYYWPNMAKDIEAYCTSCPTCATAMVRRKHLKTKFDLMAPQALLYPRKTLWARFLWGQWRRNFSCCRSIHQRNHFNLLKKQESR